MYLKSHCMSIKEIDLEHLYNFNGLPFYTAKDITTRNYFIQVISDKVKELLLRENKAWQFHQIESCSLIPSDLISKNYTEDDVFFVNDKLALKPETTASSYLYAKQLFDTNMPPLCVYQSSKSFRKEDDQPTKHCRYKEFYQLEYQCIYSKDTKNDYQSKVVPDLALFINELIKLPTRYVPSDRLPSYSLNTIDIEIWNNDKWMEICSISVRTDFVCDKKVKDKPMEFYVLEIAFGLDRLCYNSNIQLALDEKTQEKFR